MRAVANLDSEPLDAASSAPRGCVLFLPGNGHDAVRLEAVRRLLERRGHPFDLREISYPQPGRDHGTFDAFLDELAADVAASRAPVTSELSGAAGPELVYATGIGGLVALALRARGELLDVPVVMQGPVLWGLEQRWFPRIMRVPGMPRLLARAFTYSAVRNHFQKRHLRSRPSPEFVERFFAGYADADAFAAWFRWLTPELLRRLEGQLAQRPEALDGIDVWWGREDSVVGPEELDVTEAALGKRFPRREFDGWGHYPMIDDPLSWTSEVTRAVAAARPLS